MQKTLLWKCIPSARELHRTRTVVKNLHVTLDKTDVRRFIDTMALNAESNSLPSLLMQGIVTPIGSTAEGTLIQIAALPWWKILWRSRAANLRWPYGR
jgi:hypothetical protein